MVTGNADREGVEPRKVRDWDGPMVLKGPAGNSAFGKCKEPPRGLRPRRASHGDYVVTREIRQLALGNEAQPRTSVRSEEEDGG
jgi:hypothetical protein